MTELSFPKVELPLSDDEWKTIALPMGRGVIDRGGFPYKLTARDSVTDEVEIGVPSIQPARNEAILDGFVHRIDEPKRIRLAPVSTDTTYEVGLVYDPQNHSAPGGPIELTSWVAPGDNSGGRSRLTLYRFYRKPNVALGSTTYEEERPRVAPVISVSKYSSLPTSGLVLIDTLGVVRTTNLIYRANIANDGTISWSQVGGSSTDSGDIDAKINEALGAGWKQATPYETGDSIVRRFSDGIIRVGSSTNNGKDALNRETGDGRYARTSHTHGGADITSRIPFQHVDGSIGAYGNTNLGSVWTSVAVNPDGWLGRYPSALKYKDNVRSWRLDPSTVYGMTPVQYEDKQNGDTRVGFVADSYVNTLPELVELDPQSGEVEGWKYILTCVAQQVAIRDLNARLKAKEQELETLRFNQGEILAYLGLNTDETGRVITEQNGA